MQKRSQQFIRDRAINLVRLATLGGVAGAIGLTWLFSNLAIAYFSGQPVGAQSAPPPLVPVLEAPIQSPPALILRVVHHPASWSASGGTPRPPGQGPAAAPPAPPPPACHSTPSRPC